MPDASASPFRVSVILPTFNRIQYLGAAVASLLGQTRVPDEILIVDDGSTDDTAQLCATFPAPVRYRRMDRNRGKTAAINFGLANTSGDYVWIMDDDDIAPPDALANLVAPMQGRAGIGFAYGALLKFTETADGIRTFEPATAILSCAAKSLFVRLMEDCFITGGPCVLWRRAWLEAIGKLDESVLASDDYNMILKVARISDGVDVGKPVLWQRQHTGPRGPAQMNYAVSERNRRWMHFDARLLGELLPQLQLHEFIGMRRAERPLTDLETRRALFQKATIAATKNLWDIAIASLQQARATAPQPLSYLETCILSGALGSRYGVDDFIGDIPVQRRFAAAAGYGVLGGSIREAIASRLRFRIREAAEHGDFRFRRIVAAALALVRFAGWGAARVALTPILTRMGLGRRCRLVCRAAASI